MSTTPTPAPPSIQQSQQDLRAAAIAAQTPPPTPAEPQVAPPPAPAAPPPADGMEFIENQDGTVGIKIATGEVYNGKDWKEAAAKAAKSALDTKVWAKSQAAQQPPAATPQAPVAPAEDPAEVAARKFIADGFAKEMGFNNADELKQAWGQVSTTTSEIQNQSLAASFLAACPDFPNTPEAAQSLGAIMDRVHLPNTLEGMQAAHALALYSKAYQPLVQAPPVTQPQRVAPPTLPTSSPVSTGQQLDWRTAPLDQLKQAAIDASKKQ